MKAPPKWLPSADSRNRHRISRPHPFKNLSAGIRLYPPQLDRALSPGNLARRSIPVGTLEIVPEHPDIERALDGEAIKVQRHKVGHHLLAADRDGRYGATFSFYWTESGSWESDASLYKRTVSSNESFADGWEHLLASGTDGAVWDWDRLEDSASWKDRALLVLGLTGREDELADGRDVSVGAVCGFASTAVSRLLCESDGATHGVGITQPWRSFVGVAVTTAGTMSLVAYDAEGAVLEHKTFDV